MISTWFISAERKNDSWNGQIPKYNYVEQSKESLFYYRAKLCNVFSNDELCISIVLIDDVNSILLLNINSDC